MKEEREEAERERESTGPLKDRRGAFYVCVGGDEGVQQQRNTNTSRHKETHSHTCAHTHTHTLLALANNAPVIWMEDTAMARSVSFRAIWCRWKHTHTHTVDNAHPIPMLMSSSAD